MFLIGIRKLFTGCFKLMTLYSYSGIYGFFIDIYFIVDSLPQHDKIIFYISK